jgi:hypothetical protein
VNLGGLEPPGLILLRHIRGMRSSSKSGHGEVMGVVTVTVVVRSQPGLTVRCGMRVARPVRMTWRSPAAPGASLRAGRPVQGDHLPRRHCPNGQATGWNRLQCSSASGASSNISHSEGEGDRAEEGQCEASIPAAGRGLPSDWVSQVKGTASLDDDRVVEELVAPVQLREV